MGYQASSAAAAEIYHSHFEEIQQVCTDFTNTNNINSVNKIMHLIGQLHSVGGAHYQYAADADYPQIWLMSNGKTILTQLITDAKSSSLEFAAKALETIQTELEQNHLV